MSTVAPNGRVVNPERRHPPRTRRKPAAPRKPAPNPWADVDAYPYLVSIEVSNEAELPPNIIWAYDLKDALCRVQDMLDGRELMGERVDDFNITRIDRDAMLKFLADVAK